MQMFKSLFGETEKWTNNGEQVCDLDLRIMGMAEDDADENYRTISIIIPNTD